jgi:hypothetical protein
MNSRRPVNSNVGRFPVSKEEISMLAFLPPSAALTLLKSAIEHFQAEVPNKDLDERIYTAIQALREGFQDISEATPYLDSIRTPTSEMFEARDNADFARAEGARKLALKACQENSLDEIIAKRNLP